MGNRELATHDQASGLVKSVPAADWVRKLPRSVAATVLGTLVFVAADLLADASHLRLPGHNVLLWLPALMIGRSLCGYRGSALVLSGCGVFTAGAWRATNDNRVIGYLLAALAIEGIIALSHERPSVILAVLTGLTANLAKLVPKLYVIFTVGATPRHNRETLPYMLASYVVYGALAGLVCWGGAKLKRRLSKRASHEDPRE